MAYLTQLRGVGGILILSKNEKWFGQVKILGGQKSGIQEASYYCSVQALGNHFASQSNTKGRAIVEKDYGPGESHRGSTG